jgi:hypothetical protein
MRGQAAVELFIVEEIHDSSFFCTAIHRSAQACQAVFWFTYNDTVIHMRLRCARAGMICGFLCFISGMLVREPVRGMQGALENKDLSLYPTPHIPGIVLRNIPLAFEVILNKKGQTVSYDRLPLIFIKYVVSPDSLPGTSIGFPPCSSCSRLEASTFAVVKSVLFERR